MTPERYRECLDAIRLSQRGLAPLLGCSDRLPREWAHGRSSIPPKVAVWLEQCATLRHEFPDPPPPTNWRRGPEYAPEPKRKPKPAKTVRRKRSKPK
jgi:hypothetical protein